MKICQTLKLIVDKGMTVTVDWAKLKIEVWDGVSTWYTASLSTDGITCDKDAYSELENLVCEAANNRGAKLIQTSPEMYEALLKCRHALEPYNDTKPRDFKTDREKLRQAFELVDELLKKLE